MRFLTEITEKSLLLTGKPLLLAGRAPTLGVSSKLTEYQRREGVFAVFWPIFRLQIGRFGVFAARFGNV